MSSGQSLRKGSSVEPGLPNTLRMPKARSRSRVAWLTVTDLLPLLVDCRDNVSPLFSVYCSSLSLRAKRSNPECRRGDSLDCFVASLLAMTRRRQCIATPPFMVAGLGSHGIGNDGHDCRKLDRTAQHNAPLQPSQATHRHGIAGIPGT